MLKDSIIATYASMLRFLSKCRKRFDLGRTQRVAKSITQLPESFVKKHIDRIAANDRKVSELTDIVDAERLQGISAQQVSTTNGVNNLVNDIRELRTESTDSTSKLQTLLISLKEPLMRTVEQASAFSRSLEETKNESQLEKERLETLRWLSEVPYKEHHQSLSKGLLKGTGTWLSKKPQFTEWRNSSVSSILWLHGIRKCSIKYLVRRSLNGIK